MEKDIRGKQLTVIIPFLNEGKEVEDTLCSIRDTAGNSVDILLINDCSTDKYDYEKAAHLYNAGYYKNEERKGVAMSRDWGISIIDTPYFLLMDGHMRFFQNNWVEEILNAVKSNERAVYCCSCKDLAKLQNSKGGHGAFMYFFQAEKTNILSLEWIVDIPDEASIIDIPCVLGANYAASKDYWLYLKGLQGLKYYSCDEQYISIKTWMEGGRCRLIKNVETGHLFREKAPYEIMQSNFFYNKLLMIETLFPEELRKKLIRSMKAMNYAEYVRVKSELDQNKQEVEMLRSYYAKILNCGMDNFLKINEEFRLKHISKTKQHE
jgi:glycosyltransferase involved in cell wall biosynthesis